MLNETFASCADALAAAPALLGLAVRLEDLSGVLVTTAIFTAFGLIVFAIAYIIIYLVMAFFVLRWSRGVLPLAAGLAVIFAVFSAIAARRSPPKISAGPHSAFSRVWEKTAFGFSFIAVAIGPSDAAQCGPMIS